MAAGKQKPEGDEEVAALPPDDQQDSSVKEHQLGAKEEHQAEGVVTGEQAAALCRLRHFAFLDHNPSIISSIFDKFSATR